MQARTASRTSGTQVGVTRSGSHRVALGLQIRWPEPAMKMLGVHIEPADQIATGQGDNCVKAT
jgi:hypothetical protein